MGLRSLKLVVLCCASFCITFSCGQRFDHNVDLPTTRPLNIAHRGSSGTLPEHTVEAYRLAVQQGADVIECDVCVTKDLRLICSHQSWLSLTTDAREKFPNLTRTRYVQDKGRNITDVFSVDLTLAQVKQLRVKQARTYRDPSYDGRFQMSTLEEYINVAKSAGRPIGIYPETKEPLWVNSLDIIKNANTTFEDLLVEEVTRHGYTSKRHPCFIQSFEESSIRYLATKTQLPLVMLMGTGADTSDTRLRSLAPICYGIGPSKKLIIPSRDNVLQNATDLVSRAHRVGLRVHPYTFRNEYPSLAWNYMQDPYDEYERFFALGIDGYFTDFPHSFHRFLEMKYGCTTPPSSGQTVRSGYASFIALMSSIFLLKSL